MDAVHATSYDARYLAGLLLFNRRDYFAAHEVWEALWLDTPRPDKRFYQGLIQCAVALFHLEGRNPRGALRMYHSGLDYLAPFRPRHLGLDVDRLAAELTVAFSGWLHLPADAPPPALPAHFPQLSLDPDPIAWPDPADYLDHEEISHD